MLTKIRKIKNLENKNIDFEFKSLDCYGKFCGYASVFNVNLLKVTKELA